MLNAYVLESTTKPSDHGLRGLSKRDYLRFSLKLAENLMGSRKGAGGRTSSKHEQVERLNLNLDIGWFKRRTVLCAVQKIKEKTTSWRNEKNQVLSLQCSSMCSQGP